MIDNSPGGSRYIGARGWVIAVFREAGHRRCRFFFGNLVRFLLSHLYFESFFSPSGQSNSHLGSGGWWNEWLRNVIPAVNKWCGWDVRKPIRIRSRPIKLWMWFEIWSLLGSSLCPAQINRKKVPEGTPAPLGSGLSVGESTAHSQNIGIGNWEKAVHYFFHSNRFHTGVHLCQY